MEEGALRTAIAGAWATTSHLPSDGEHALFFNFTETSFRIHHALKFERMPALSRLVVLARIAPRLSAHLRTARICRCYSRLLRQGWHGSALTSDGMAPLKQPLTCLLRRTAKGARRGRFLENLRTPWSRLSPLRTHNLNLHRRNMQPLRLLPLASPPLRRTAWPFSTPAHKHASSTLLPPPLIRTLWARTNPRPVLLLRRPEDTKQCSTCFRESCFWCQRTIQSATQLRCIILAPSIGPDCISLQRANIAII